MKILNKNVTILDYLVNPHYFDNHTEVYPKLGTKSYWRRVESDAYLLNYNISYAAKDQNKDEYFIKYEGLLSLHCILDNLDKDSFEIVKIKEDMHKTFGSFIEENSFQFFKLLKFRTVTFSEAEAKREKSILEELMKTSAFEDKSDKEREFEKSFNKNQIKIESIKIN